ncbi:MAG: protein kinase, partial [Anaerolineae bacterium]|nr:protein kinase [Anaerolineae bacterium]
MQVPSLGDATTDVRFEAGETVAGRYRLERQLGRGGMAVVYHAQDLLVGEAVALKFMLPRLLRTQKGQRLFIHEAQVARRLRHENIVAVHDVGRTPEGVLYLSMEFLEGRSLRDFLRQRRLERRLLSVRYAVRILQQVLDALDYAHRMVVHRDI